VSIPPVTRPSANGSSKSSKLGMMSAGLVFVFVFLFVKSMLTGVGDTVPWNAGPAECSRESILRSSR
jgi:hypothetical protein